MRKMAITSVEVDYGHLTVYTEGAYYEFSIIDGWTNPNGYIEAISLAEEIQLHKVVLELVASGAIHAQHYPWTEVQYPAKNRIALMVMEALAKGAVDLANRLEEKIVD